MRNKESTLPGLILGVDLTSLYIQSSKAVLYSVHSKTKEN